ncbi:MAG: group II intron maturase-specific domain-containing protein [Planctomycetaceae bacterium]
MPRRDHPPAAVILCRTAEQAEAALALVREWTGENGLTLHPEKTRIVDVDGEAFDFLGYSFRREHRWPRKKSLQKLKETLRQKTKRTNGHSLQVIIADVNRTLRGWFEYFQHAHKWTFERIDSWLRMRLRSILRKRAGRHGRGRGWDHHRWKNAFFAEQGLFHLKAAHAQACQSSMR